MKVTASNVDVDCDPGNSSSAESSTSITDYNINGTITMTASANNDLVNNKRASFLRGTSEPPPMHSTNYHEKTGLKRCGFPIKVAGITMGSQENLAADSSGDDESKQSHDNFSIFGKRLRRSITPLRVPPITIANSTTQPGAAYGFSNEDEIFSTPFGSTASKQETAKGIFQGSRKSDIGQWGQRRYQKQSTNGSSINEPSKAIGTKEVNDNTSTKARQNCENSNFNLDRTLFTFQRDFC